KSSPVETTRQSADRGSQLDNSLVVTQGNAIATARKTAAIANKAMLHLGHAAVGQGLTSLRTFFANCEVGYSALRKSVMALSLIARVVSCGMRVALSALGRFC